MNEFKAFKGTYQFVKMNRNEGISAKGKPFDIGKIVLSDGLESVEHDIQPNLVPALEPYLKKKDMVEVILEATTDYRGVSYIVTDVKVLSPVK